MTWLEYLTERRYFLKDTSQSVTVQDRPLRSSVFITSKHFITSLEAGKGAGGSSIFIPFSTKTTKKGKCTAKCTERGSSANEIEEEEQVFQGPQNTQAVKQWDCNGVQHVHGDADHVGHVGETETEDGAAGIRPRAQICPVPSRCYLRSKSIQF